MSDAFYCDACDEYHDGEPAETLYIKDGTNTRNKTDYSKVGDVCADCWRAIGGDGDE